MKKLIALILVFFLMISCYSMPASILNKKTNNEEVTIYQISPSVTNKIITSYLKESNPSITPNNPKDNSYFSYNYIIITTENIANEITSSNFIAWKESLGYKIKIVNITDSLIQNQPGDDLPAMIRNFLREYYPIWGIQYLLIIGNQKTIPMRYCYPDPQNHRFDIFDHTSGEVPTDYYYADLSLTDIESWDSDNDGYYGEYTHDNPDFLPEIYVGRIPVNDVSRIIYTLDKTVNFEQDKGTWKHNALNAGAFFYFDNEDNYYNKMDGAVLSHHIEQDFMDNWTISHYSEQEGLEISEYNWPAISEEAFINDWRINKYSIVNWQGHGWTDSVARKVWTNDDGDEVPEGNEISWPSIITRYSNLDDDYPSIVTAVSCYVGCPEPNPSSIGNLGIDLLTDPSFGAGIGIIASARSPYGSSNWPNSPGGSDQIIYEFNKNLIINKEKIGEALYNSKYYCNDNYGWAHFAEYLDMYTFNLYGDPSLLFEGAIDNNPPKTPVISGPTKCTTDKSYNYTMSTTDPDNDNLYYWIEWYEGFSDGYWDGPYQSGVEITRENTWDKRGKHIIKVKAKDIHGAVSDWATLEISMPKNKQINNYLHKFPRKTPSFITINTTNTRSLKKN